MKNCKVIAHVDVPRGGSAFVKANGDVYARGPAVKVGKISRPKGKMVWVKGQRVIAGDPAGREHCGKVGKGRKKTKKATKSRKSPKGACPRTKKQVAATRKMLESRWGHKRFAHVPDKSSGYCDTFTKGGKKAKKSAKKSAAKKSGRKSIKKGSAAWKAHERRLRAESTRRIAKGSPAWLAHERRLRAESEPRTSSGRFARPSRLTRRAWFS